MNAKTTVAFDEIKKILEAASADEGVSAADYVELLTEVETLCVDSIEALGEGDDEGEDLVDTAVETGITDDGKVGGD